MVTSRLMKRNIAELPCPVKEFFEEFGVVFLPHSTVAEKIWIDHQKSLDRQTDWLYIWSHEMQMEYQDMDDWTINPTAVVSVETMIISLGGVCDGATRASNLPLTEVVKEKLRAAIGA